MARITWTASSSSRATLLQRVLFSLVRIPHKMKAQNQKSNPVNLSECARHCSFYLRVRQLQSRSWYLTSISRFKVGVKHDSSLLMTRAVRWISRSRRCVCLTACMQARLGGPLRRRPPNGSWQTLPTSPLSLSLLAPLLPLEGAWDMQEPSSLEEREQQ